MPAGLLRNAAVLVAVIASGCINDAGRFDASVPAHISAATHSQDPDVATLYAEAEAALVDGKRALYAWRSGNRAVSQAGFASAHDRLSTTITRCAAHNNCELARVLAAQDALFDGQARALVSALPRTRETAALNSAVESAAGSPVLIDFPASVASMNLLNGRDLAELIEVNEPVRAALREWLTWMRPFLLDSWENYQYMRYKMWPAYEAAGLPEALLFGILAKESGGKVHAVSGSGAAGPLQFMPATGQRYGLAVAEGFDLRYDPAAATQANVAYLNDQFARLNNDLALVLGAYNGGEGRMARLSPNGTRHFWDRRVYDQLPPETRAYVPMVLAAAWLFMHPEQYGLQFPAVDLRPGEITLATELSINELSICLGQIGNARGWFRTLRNLNPRWDANDRLPAGTRLEAPASAAAAYPQRCTDAKVVSELNALQNARIPGAVVAPRLGAARTVEHTVVKGETLSRIARKHGCGIKEIATANSIAAPRYALKIGQRLQVPTCRT